MSNIDKQALRSTSDRDWFEDWFKREFHPDKTGPYIKDQLFFAVRAARAPLLDELETKDKRNAELEDLLEAEIKSWMQRYDSANNRREAAEKRIAELSASHGNLREAMAGIHNTIRGEGAYTPLAAILNASKRAYEESAAAAGKGEAS
ncbi:ead/Ea22-like family protein [Enterobacter hormaechei]|uniref:hypothetical protein n=1 Tax=Enterobacter hormaechei TaxID=158836 RepID=UPI000F825981|nr:hypothetical protein [Enterobacter hormaechei]RTM82754.1 hypothetical protein EKO02_09240 [Enterobacter hormaechei subsp. xiangfangensis]VAK67515.1 Phage EaD protein [Enterobacter hormaechei]